VSLPALVEALRPRQWPKNALVFAGLLFAAKLGDAHRWFEAIMMFVSFCAVSSAAYLINDLQDLEHDRAHPLKRSRPIARGAVTAAQALRAALALALFGIAIAAALGLIPLAYVTGFVLLQLAYSYRLKHIPLLDVMAIGALFVIRAAAGATAIHVRISPWLLLCAALLALFLGFAKRRAELALVGADRTPGRPVLDGYSLALVDQLVAVVAASTIIAYALYTFTARNSHALMITSPVVFFGVFRYLLLIHRNDLGEEPENVLLGDRQIQLAIVVWAALAAILLYAT
jgi:4-hydroxybenzoate polyprenyltransferase